MAQSRFFGGATAPYNCTKEHIHICMYITTTQSGATETSHESLFGGARWRFGGATESHGKPENPLRHRRHRKDHIIGSTKETCTQDGFAQRTNHNDLAPVAPVAQNPLDQYQ